MTRDRDLVSDPSAERIAVRTPDDALLAAGAARTGGDPARAPRSLTATELDADDEAVASNDEWDDPDRL